MAFILHLLVFLSFCSLSSYALTCNHSAKKFQIENADLNLKCKAENGQLLSSDLNGDGRSDWFCNDLDDGDTDYYALATIGGTFFLKKDAGTTNWCNAGAGEMLTGDMNGDGRADLICRYADGNSFEVRYYIGNRFSSPSKMNIFFNCEYGTSDLKIGDVNADHFDDLVCSNKAGGTVTVLYNIGHHRSRRHLGYKSAAMSYKPVFIFEFCLGAGKTFHLGDLNGDRAMDLVCHDISVGSMEIAIADRNHGFSKSMPFSTSSSPSFAFCTPTSVTTFFGVNDIDGDHRADLFCYVGLSGEEIILTDSKLLFTNTPITGGAFSDCTYGSDNIVLADTNGDHRADIICDMAVSAPDTTYGLNVHYSICSA